MAFTRLQLLPRFGGGRGDATLVIVEQAFGRVTPITGTEISVSVGKFDSVFGIEYLDNQANFRTGITPSLLARYTTGTSVGLKAFFRQQIRAAVVGGQPEHLRHQQRQLRRGAAVRRRQPDRRAGGLGPAWLRAKLPWCRSSWGAAG